MTVIDIERPPAETPNLVLKPLVVGWQLWLVAIIEVIFKASKYSSWIATAAWFITMGGFFVFDDWERNWFVFGPILASIATGLAWVFIHVIVLAPYRYRQLLDMAGRMEYRFYKDYFVYTVGDEKWKQVSYEKLKEVELRKTKDRNIGHLKFHFEGEKVTFAARKVPNINYAETARNDVQRLVDQYRAGLTSGKA